MKTKTNISCSCCDNTAMYYIVYLNNRKKERKIQLCFACFFKNVKEVKVKIYYRNQILDELQYWLLKSKSGLDCNYQIIYYTKAKYYHDKHIKGNQYSRRQYKTQGNWEICRLLTETGQGASISYGVDVFFTFSANNRLQSIF